MKPYPRVLIAFQREFYSWRIWQTRIVMLGFAVLAGLTVVFFTWACERTLSLFHLLESHWWWAPLLWTPACTAGIVWATRRFAPGAAGSGIPQVMVALSTPPGAPRRLFVSTWLALTKMVLTALGLLGGLSAGREGPSVQIAAGVMHAARRWLPKRNGISDQGLLIAGGAAGIAAAFNTPLGGVMFAIEELSREPEQRNHGLVMAAIVLSGLVAVAVYGNSTYFGVITVPEVGLSVLGPALVVALASGLSGGLFSRLLVRSLSGDAPDRFSRYRAAHPVRFAAACGLAVAVIGVVSLGSTYGSGYLHTRNLLEGHHDSNLLYVLLKFIATWITTWSGVPAGIFAPSLAIGAALGNDVGQLFPQTHFSILIALGMVGFLAAVTQAPITSFIIVMEMVDGHAMVLSLMGCAALATGVSRLISVPLYPALAQLQRRRLPAAKREPGGKPVAKPGSPPAPMPESAVEVETEVEAAANPQAASAAAPEVAATPDPAAAPAVEASPAAAAAVDGASASDAAADQAPQTRNTSAP